MEEAKPIFAHTADTHLRTSQYVKKYRGDDFFNAIINVIETARSYGLKYIVHGGDFLDVKTPESGVINQVGLINDKLRLYNMTMLVISGNHELSAINWINALRNLAVSLDTDLSIRCIDHQKFDMGPDIGTIYGLPFMPVSELMVALQEAPTADFLLWHGMVREFANFPSADVVSIYDLLPFAEKFQSILLGDVHKFQYYQFGTAGIIGYPGSTELTKDNEEVDKAFGMICRTKLPIGVAHSVFRIPIKTRPVIRLRIGDEQTLQDAIDTKIVPTRAAMPMIFVKYHDGIPNAVQRLIAAKHSDSIFGATPLDVMTETPLVPVSPANLSLEQFIPLFVASDKPNLAALGKRVIDADIKPASVLAEYIDTQLKEFNKN